MEPEQVHIPDFVVRQVGALQLQLAAAGQTIAQLQAELAEAQAKLAEAQTSRECPQCYSEVPA